jgi:hypothetical protein
MKYYRGKIKGGIKRKHRETDSDFPPIRVSGASGDITDGEGNVGLSPGLISRFPTTFDFPSSPLLSYPLKGVRRGGEEGIGRGGFLLFP